VNDLQAAVSAYSRTRRVNPVVRVWLVSGDRRYVKSATAAGDGDELVLLDVYADKPADMLDLGEDVEEPERHVPREALVVRPAAIAKVELLYEYPGAGRDQFGFSAS